MGGDGAGYPYANDPGGTQTCRFHHVGKGTGQGWKLESGYLIPAANFDNLQEVLILTDLKDGEEVEKQ